MKVLGEIFSIALVAGLAGCASTSGARSQPTASAAAAPHERGKEMMAGMCPMQVAGTTVAASDVEGGVGLKFTTTTGDVAELRQRVRRMAEKHDGRGSTMMGGHAAPSAGDDAEHQHGEQGGGGMMMPAATASVEDIDRGARLTLRPKDPAQLVPLREHVHMKAERMTGGECPMMPVGVGEPSAFSSNPGVADHDAHHPGKE